MDNLAILLHLKEGKKPNLRATFSSTDEDGDGNLTAEELTAIVTDEQVDLIIRFADMDGDGFSICSCKIICQLRVFIGKCRSG